LYPLTTPVGFYDGTLKLKSTYAWPGAALSYQTQDGANDFGLYDMQGNVWELINDWYTNNYYATSPYNNPTGPLVGFTMPDGKAYRGMRGGNWYNGNIVNGINDGHSRVSNRNPSYFRGPLDPNHPWYHVGFRVARKVSVITDVKENTDLDVFQCYNYPNPFQNCTTIQVDLSKVQKVKINIYNAFGELLLNLVDQELKAGTHRFNWCNENSNSGIYFYSVQSNKQILIHKMIVIQ